MRIPSSLNKHAFFPALFNWKASLKWFLEQYTLTEFEADLSELIALDPERANKTIPDFKSLSKADQVSALTSYYLKNEWKIVNALLTDRAKFDEFFTVKPKKSSKGRLENINTITSSFPAFYCWAEADAGGAILAVAEQELIGLDSYQDSVLHLSELPSTVLAGLADESTRCDYYIPEALVWAADARGIKLT